MDWVLFITVLTVSFTVVRIGAIAFQLTGLEWSLAKFQALSCFTGTGFTTKEAELITGNKRRRRIASVLMVLGNAGLVIMIATFASSLNPGQAIKTGLSRRLLPFIPADLVRWVNLLIIVVAVFVIYKVFTNPKFSRKLTEFLKKKIIKRELFKPVSFEELLLATGGYGVSNIKIHEGNPIADKALSESGLREEDITVLAIVREDATMANPRANAKILTGDELLCFGKLEDIRKKFA